MSEPLKTTDPEPTFLEKIAAIIALTVLAAAALIVGFIAVLIWGFIFGSPQCVLGRTDRPIYADGCVP